MPHSQFAKFTAEVIDAVGGEEAVVLFLSATLRCAAEIGMSAEQVIEGVRLAADIVGDPADVLGKGV